MTPELVGKAIETAISAGLATGLTEAAKKGAAEAYEALKSLLRKRYGNESDVSQAITKLEAKPDSAGKKLTLTEELATVNVDSDPEIITAARTLVEALRSLPATETHVQSAIGTGIAQADRGATATVTLHTTEKI